MHCLLAMGPAALTKDQGKGKRQTMRGDIKLYHRNNTPFWWYRFFYNGKLYRGSTETTDLKKAERVIKAKRDELGLSRKLHEPAVSDRERKTTVGQLFDALENDYAIRGKLNTASKAHFKAARKPFEYFRALELTEEAIDRQIQEWRAEGYAPATINFWTQLLGQAYKLGRKCVGAGPDIGKLEVRNARKGFFEKSEFESLVSHLPEDLQDSARFAFYTGMRKSEIASLKWAQYDRNGQILTLEAEHSKNGELRKIPIEGELLVIIERRAAVRSYKGENGEIVMSPLIFYRSKGSRLREGQPIRSFRKSWRAACEAAGIGTKLFHDFRRSAARNLIRAGISETVAMEITGHRTRSMFKRYNITDERDIREALRKEQEYLKSLPVENNVAEFKKAESK